MIPERDQLTSFSLSHSVWSAWIETYSILCNREEETSHSVWSAWIETCGPELQR